MNDILAIFSWYLVLLLTGLLCFPVTFRALPMFPDRGYSLSRVLGLLVWGYSFWILTTFGFLSNDFGGALVGLAVLLTVNFLLHRNAGIKTVINWLKDNWKVWLFSEGVFLAAFIFMFVLRASDPIISGTEKPMELAFINAILESPSFPPADPWLSGYSISYYYFGYIMVALLARIAGVAGSIAFNLAIISWFALTAQAAFGLLLTMLQRWQISTNQEINPASATLRMRKWALLGGLVILIVSNWTGLLEVMHSSALFWETDSSGDLQSDFWPWLGVKELDQPPDEPFTGVPERNGGIWWWRASRVIQDFDMQWNSKEIIDEFPFFSFYLADLHPHVLSMPFILLALAVSANFFYSSREVVVSGGLFRQLIRGITQQTGGVRDIANRFSSISFWFAAWIFGSLAFINIWDFPVYVALFSAIYILKHGRQTGWQPGLILDFLEMGLALGIVGVLFYIPYYVGFSSQAGGILPSLSFFTRGIYFWIMFAPLLVTIIAWLVHTARKNMSIHYLISGFKISAAIVFGLWVLSYLLGALFAAGNETAGLLNTLGFSRGGGDAPARLIELSQLFSNLHGTSDDLFLLLGSLARRLSQPGTWLTLLIIIALSFGLFLRGNASRDKPIGSIDSHELKKPGTAYLDSIEFNLLLILVGAGLTLLPEFFYLRDQFGWRMNTIFKFYFQTWIVWGIAASYSMTVLFMETKKLAGFLIKTGITLSLAAGLIYPYFAISDRIAGTWWSNLAIDGAKYISDYNSAEYNAIQWLKDAPYGVVAEAVGGSYSGYARISTHTGYPTVLGWPGHESQWRGGSEEMGSREQDIGTLYRTSDWETARSIIEKYGIRYIFLGNLERIAYRATERKFSDHLMVVFQQDDVTIFEVPGFRPLFGSWNW